MIAEIVIDIVEEDREKFLDLFFSWYWSVETPLAIESLTIDGGLVSGEEIEERLELVLPD